MSLSADLLSQFAKITKDEEETKTEKTVYGTAVEQDGSIFVQFDGSDQLTPVTTTVEVETGERVMVQLKNHTATITGNITSPAVRIETVRIIVDNVTGLETIIEDMVSDEELEVEKARITALENSNTQTNETIQSITNSISELNTIIADLQSRVTALEGGSTT